MHTLAQKPRFWLALQMVAVAVVGGALGLIALRHIPDSPGYVDGAQLSFIELLRYYRTIGYPYLLRVVALVSPQFALIPWVHYALLCGSVLLLDSAMRRFGARAWEALAISSGFFWAALDSQLLNCLGTDFLGVVGAAVTMALLFWVVSAPRQIGPWLALTVALAVTYHIRPAYIFLVALVPSLGLVLLGLRARRDSMRPPWLKMGVALGVLSVGPFVAWCLMRLVLVGHFGLVSLGGYNLASFAVELLDQEMIETELSEQYRPLARQIMQQRRQRGFESIFRGGIVVEMRQWELTFNENVHRIAAPLVAERTSWDRVQLNETMTDFSHEIIQHRPGRYLLLVSYNFLRAVAKLPYLSRAVQLLVLVWLFLWAVRVWKQGRRGLCPIAKAADDDRTVPLAVACLALSFFVASMALAVLVIPVGGRLVLAAGVFVPSLLALGIAREIGQLGRHTEKDGGTSNVDQMPGS